MRQNTLFLSLKDLIQNSKKSAYANYIIGEIISKGSDLATILLVSFILSSEDYGYISVAYSIIPILIVFLTLNIPSAIVRKFYEFDQNIEEYIYSNLIFVLTFAITISVIMFIFSESISLIIKIPEPLLFTIIILALFRGLIEFYKALLVAEKKSKEYSVLSIVYHISLNILFIILIFVLSKSYLSKSIADIVVSIIISIYIFSYMRKYIGHKLIFKHIRYSLIFSLPLILQTLSNVILGQIDRVMINTFVGASETGVYSFSYTIGSIVGILIIALNRAWIPYFYEHRSSLIKLSSTIKKTSAFLIIISTILSAFSPIILVHFVSDDYAAALNIIPIIVLSNMFIYFYILYSNYFFYEKKTYLVSINTVTASVLNILLNYFLLPRFGYQIASYTTLVSYLFLFILHYYTVKLTLNYASISIRTIGLPILLVCINTAIVMLLHQSNLNDISQSLIFSVIIGFDVLLFLNNWITVEVPEEKN